MSSPEFTKAIVRTPGQSMIRGLTTAGLGLPDYELALKQHAAYTEALRSCGLEVKVLEALEAFPDSCFVEDVALLTPACAIITRPAASSRRDETKEMKQVLRAYYTRIEEIQAPATLDAGDIIMVGTHYYVGLSARTNEMGAQQLIDLLQQYGYSGSMVAVEDGLHLKSGLAYLEKNNLVAAASFIQHEAFRSFNLLAVEADETYAANCIWVNDRVIIPAGFPTARKMIEQAAYHTIPLDMSEFQKLDGGLSCLSLRF